MLFPALGPTGKAILELHCKVRLFSKTKCLSEGWVISTSMTFERLLLLLSHVTEKGKFAEDGTDAELGNSQDQKKKLFQ